MILYIMKFFQSWGLARKREQPKQLLLPPTQPVERPPRNIKVSTIGTMAEQPKGGANDEG